MPAKSELVHGTCIAVAKRAVLFRGSSGAGKSDLALRCLAAPPLSSLGHGGQGLSATGPLSKGAAAGAAILVSDDQVELTRDGTGILARPPASIAGKLEVRGLGIVELHHVSAAELVLVFDLVADPAGGLPHSDGVARMPEIAPPKFTRTAALDPARQGPGGSTAPPSARIPSSRDPGHPLRTATYLGVEICRLTIAPFEASAPLKVLLALERVTGQMRT